MGRLSTFEVYSWETLSRVRYQWQDNQKLILEAWECRERSVSPYRRAIIIDYLVKGPYTGSRTLVILSIFEHL